VKHAEVILLAPLKKKGGAGTLIKVASGFARNYLLPRGLAVLASKSNKQELAHQMRLAEHRKARAKKDALAYAEKLAKEPPLEFKRRVGDQGKLFGSVTGLDVFEALRGKGILVDKTDVHLAETIRQLGPAQAEVRLAHDVRATVPLIVTLES
jgi:large subunit ribosomal protein L9